MNFLILAESNEQNPTRIESTLSQNVPSTTPVVPKANLKEILLSNYDKTLATKIGIKDFLPVELMRESGGDNGNNNNEESNMEFIPFEQIDQRYPREYGVPVFDPNRDKAHRKLYRTNPSIPRPESKYGTRANVYEQIIDIKKQKVDPKGIFFYLILISRAYEKRSQIS